MSERATSTSDLAGLPVEPERRDSPADGRAQAMENGGEEREPLLERGDADGYVDRWSTIQRSFVDEPRRSVEDADALVADLMQRLATGFASERSRLESQWDSGGDVSTEELRVALTRYRSFFDRLLRA